METLLDQLNLMTSQLQTLNAGQALYPIKNVQITIQLTDTKLHHIYTSTDQLLDLYLDSIIIHQSLVDDYKVRIAVDEPFEDVDEDEDPTLVMDVCITKMGHDILKKALDKDPSALLKVTRRKDPRIVKRKEREPLPSWAIVDDDQKPLPAYMYLAPSSEAAEAAYVNGGDIPYKKVHIKKN